VNGLRLLKTQIADQLRDAYETLAATTPEWALQVEPEYVLSPTPPTLDVFQGRTPARDLETAGFGELAGGYNFTLRARVGTSDQDAGQELLDELADDASQWSILGVLEDDPTFGGYATGFDAIEFSGIQGYPDGSGTVAWIGFEIQILVIAAQS
jgi:hypothetical protein